MDKRNKEGVQLSGEITVPFCPESKLSGVQYVDFMYGVWYKRTVTLPKQEGRTVIHFGAVDYHARVFVNGKLAGSHKGGYVSFSFNITNLVREGENEIAVFNKIYAIDSYLYDSTIYSFTYQSYELPLRMTALPGKGLSVKSGIVSMPTGEAWHNMDGLTEIELTRKNFDAAFMAKDAAGWHDEDLSAAKIRRQNQMAWRVSDGDYYYDLLLQKDGSILLGFGYYHPESVNEVR